MVPDDKVEIPTWVCTQLGLKEESIAYLEVTNGYGGGSRYNLFLEFLAHRAVNITEETIPDSPDSTLEPLKSRKLTLNRREYPGLLSALSIEDISVPSYVSRTHPNMFGGLSDAGDSDDEGDSDNENEPSYAQFGFGFGRSKLKAPDETTVCVSHCPPTRIRSSTLYFYAAGPETIRSLINSIFEWAFLKRQPDRKPREGKYELYSMELEYQTANWVKHGWKKSRSLDTIFLPHGEMDAILADFKSFSATGTKEWYLKHGLPHRRSYLFYGPPGTGKTSTIRALAGELKLAACFMELGDDEVGNMHLTTALRNMPQPAMLVIEDVDAIFNEDRVTMNMSSPLTFSGLLNALDGLISSDGVLTVMTTNHPERLDPALIRAGRIDRKFEFKKPKNKEFFNMFKSFYSDATKQEAQEFADKVIDRQEKESRSIATLMELFIFTRECSARECIDKMDEFFKEFYPKSGRDHLAWLYS